ncbi:MAG: molybdenum cofactor biosynthesis protein MoaE [Gemmatimonadales bacterium]|jgi:molybdopterin synthase catalytic subunit|nr:MAG: molybdenum cofactor biosynthesis protein MoaE [Gemmatimonadales bacterium]
MAVAVITSEPLRVEDLLGEAPAPSDGARVVFVGVVRDHAEGRPVRGMRYEGYEPMAAEVLRAIVEEAEERHDVGAVSALHRLGELEIGEASVAILVSGPHRDDAYRASRYVIEEIKRRLPVWKHEHFADGSARWVPGTPLGSQAGAPLAAGDATLSADGPPATREAPGPATREVPGGG